MLKDQYIPAFLNIRRQKHDPHKCWKCNEIYMIENKFQRQWSIPFQKFDSKRNGNKLLQLLVSHR